MADRSVYKNTQEFEGATNVKGVSTFTGVANFEQKLNLSDGGTVAQATNKGTAVTLNTLSGQITLQNTEITNGNQATFTLNNSKIGANDIVVVNHHSVGTLGGYVISAHTVTAGSCKFTISNQSGGALSEAIVLSFAVIGGSTS